MGSTTAGPVTGPMLFRVALGEVLRAARMRRSMTLRQLSAAARISLGYISEVERGQKEASSELLAALCEALDVPLSEVLRLVSDRVEVAETDLDVAGRLTTPHVVPAAPAGGDVVAAA